VSKHTTRLSGLGLVATAMTVLLASPACSLKVVDGPVVLHSNLCGHWGGHTFSYVVEGKRYIFWTGTLYKWEKRQDGKKKFPVQVVGQYPRAGTGAAPAIYTFDEDAADLFYAIEPLLFRTPDGYLHMIVGTYHATDDPLYTPGRLKYYRSARPEDVSEWVDRTELLPTSKLYNAFHLRMNVGVTLDGKRAVIAVLCISRGGVPVPWNTPVIFYGQREGPDFRFSEPVKYHDPLPFFYPQVAALPAGIVLVGEVWENTDHVTARLIHLDWQGNILHEEALPSSHSNGTYVSYDMRPERPGVWNRLRIYERYTPRNGTNYHYFLTYDVKSRKLQVVNKIPVEIGYSNMGKWLHVSPAKSVFINNPMQGQYWAWMGDILGGGDATHEPLARTNPLELGYINTGCALIPNPLTGSVTSPREIYLVSDAMNPGSNWSERGPQSLLLWRLKWDR